MLGLKLNHVSKRGPWCRVFVRACSNQVLGIAFYTSENRSILALFLIDDAGFAQDILKMGPGTIWDALKHRYWRYIIFSSQWIRFAQNMQISVSMRTLWSNLYTALHIPLQYSAICPQSLVDEYGNRAFQVVDFCRWSSEKRLNSRVAHWALKKQIQWIGIKTE